MRSVVSVLSVFALFVMSPFAQANITFTLHVPEGNVTQIQYTTYKSGVNSYTIAKGVNPMPVRTEGSLPVTITGLWTKDGKCQHFTSSGCRINDTHQIFVLNGCSCTVK